MAKLFFKYGAMNSGKTTLLMQTAYNYEERGLKVLVLKPSKDLKAGNMISSRLGVTREVDYLVKPDDNIFKYMVGNEDIACILVDEAQFLSNNQVDQLLRITTDLNIPVICYGLRTDFKTNGFSGSSRLLEVAHEISEMKTICECGSKATFNGRFVNNIITVDGEQIAIDGTNNVTYKSMCPKCYYKKIKLSK